MTKRSVLNLTVKGSRVIILLLLFIVFSLASEQFWGPGNWENILNIMQQQAPFLIMLALSMTLIIITCGIDLSLGASISLSSYLAAMVLVRTNSVTAAIVTALAVGIAVGIANAVLITYIHVPAFVATFSMQWICKGIVLIVSRGNQIYNLGENFRELFNANRFTYLIVALVCIAATAFLLSKTVFGKEAYYVGCNPVAASMTGVNASRILVTVFALSGTISAVTGLMYIANLGTADPTMGNSFPLRAIAAALVGGASLGGAKGKATDALVGAFIMVTLQNGMIHIGVPSIWQDFIQGVIIILAIVLERCFKRIQIHETAKKEETTT